VICLPSRRQAASDIECAVINKSVEVPGRTRSSHAQANPTANMANTAAPMMPLHLITMETPLQEVTEDQHVDSSIPTPAPIEVFSEGGPTSVAYFGSIKETDRHNEKRIDDKIDSGHASSGSSDNEEPDAKPENSKIIIPPSKWTPMCHPRVAEVSKEVDGDFLER
jgi:hypothetical protein